MRRALLALTGLVISSPWPWTETASACEKITVTLTARDALAQRYVLLGKVVENPEWDSSVGRPLRYTLEPVRVWKGRWPGDRKRFRYETVGSAGCGYPLRLGAYYVIAASDEPMVTGSTADPVPLPDAHDLVGALDRARKRPPLRLPEEVAAKRVTCVPKWIDPTLAQDIAAAERIVVGRVTSARPAAGAVVILEASRGLKGDRARRLTIRLPVHPVVAAPAERGIWMLGVQELDGSHPVVRHDVLAREDKVRAAVRRGALWRTGPDGCPTR